LSVTHLQAEVHQANNVVYTDATNMEALLQDSPALLLYPSIMGLDNRIVVSNGVQTNLLLSQHLNCRSSGYYDYLSPAIFLDDALGEPTIWYDIDANRLVDITTYEPDSSSTSRISAMLQGDQAAFYIALKNIGDAGASLLHDAETLGNVRINLLPARYEEETPYGDEIIATMVPQLMNGHAYTICTYHGDNKSPLLPFASAPLETHNLKARTAE